MLAYLAFPARHRTKLPSTNPLERLNKEVKRRADVVGIFPDEDSINRLIGAVLFGQNDAWQSQYRSMQVEAFGLIEAAQIDPPFSISTQAARPMSSKGYSRICTSLTDATRGDTAGRLRRLELKREVMAEDYAAETLHGFFKSPDVCYRLIRIWIAEAEAG